MHLHKYHAFLYLKQFDSQSDFKFQPQGVFFKLRTQNYQVMVYIVQTTISFFYMNISTLT